MKNTFKILSLLLALALLLGCLAACRKDPAENSGPEDTEHQDYAAFALDMNSDTLKQVVTVKMFIDGDTTHFNVPSSVSDSGVLKARYLAVNTPESTGKIEEYGKKASNFTKTKLSSAYEILVESDDANWNLDSTGGRHLVWIWYKPDAQSEYRNLNIEILQEGLAVASSSANNRYGDTCTKAIAQAKREKLNIYSGEKDPDFPYGEAIPVTLKEIRCNIEEYNGKKVSFEGVITKNYNNGVYIEDYDAETDRYYGIYVYYGFGLTGDGLDILEVGNRSRIVGSVQYYEGGGTYQVSGLTYRAMKPDDPNNIMLISKGNAAAFVPVSVPTLAGGKVTVDLGEDKGEKEFDCAFLAMDTSVELREARITDVYMTSNEDSSSYGALSLTVEYGGKTITVRTNPFYGEDGKLIDGKSWIGKTIDVKGVVAYFNGNYQVRVFALSDITFY
ncbi:MAG: thermonuclease family protein [Clostridia bacterium]|nr:thermonuclease family protein [Clostridia bacterium]